MAVEKLCNVGSDNQFVRFYSEGPKLKSNSESSLKRVLTFISFLLNPRV